MAKQNIEIGFLHPTERAIYYTEINNSISRTMYIGYSIEKRKYGKMSFFPKTTYVFSLHDFYWAEPEKQAASIEEICLAIKRITGYLEEEISSLNRFCFE